MPSGPIMFLAADVVLNPEHVVRFLRKHLKSISDYWGDRAGAGRLSLHSSNSTPASSLQSPLILNKHRRNIFFFFLNNQQQSSWLQTQPVFTTANTTPCSCFTMKSFHWPTIVNCVCFLYSEATLAAFSLSHCWEQLWTCQRVKKTKKKSLSTDIRTFYSLYVTMINYNTAACSWTLSV